MAQASVEPGVEGSHFCREACRWDTAQAEFAGREEEASWAEFRRISSSKPSVAIQSEFETSLGYLRLC